MRKYFSIGVLLFLSVVLTTTGSGFAADSLNFTESYNQRVVCHRENGSHVCEVVDSGRFWIVGQVALSGVNIDQFNEESPFNIQVNNFQLQRLLKDDPTYVSGDHRARFVYEDSDDYGRPFRYLTVSLRWTAKKLTFTVIGRTPYLDPILAGDYLAAEPGPISGKIFASLDFANSIFADFEIDVAGYVNRMTVKRRRQEFEVSNIFVYGVGVHDDQKPK